MKNIVRLIRNKKRHNQSAKGQILKPILQVMVVVDLLISSFTVANAATKSWVGTGGGAWSTASNWTPSGVPATGDDVTIPVNQSANITSVPAITLNSLTINGTCVFAASSNGNTITISSTMTVASGKTLTLNSNNGTRPKITLSNTATGTINGTVTCNHANDIFTNNGTLIMAPAGLINGVGGFVNAASATLKIGSTNGITALGTASGNIQTSGSRTFTAGANYEYNGVAAQATGTGLTSSNALNLVINNTAAAVTLSANTTITGTLTVKAGSTLAKSTFTLATPAIVMEAGATTGSTISGSAALTLTGPITVNNMGTGNAGATISSPLATTAVRTLTIADDGTNAADLTISGVVSGTGGGISKAGSGTLKLSGSNNFTGGVSVTSGTVLVNNANGLGSASGTISVSANAILDMDVNTLSYGTLTNNGTIRFSGAANGLAVSTGAVEYYGSTAQTIKDGTYSSLIVSNTTGASINAATTTTNLILNASGILNIAATKSLTVSSNLTNDGTLNLLSDANGSATLLTPSTVAGSGTTNVNQYLTGSGGSTPNGRFWYLSNPLESSTANGFGVNGSSSKLWKYIESSHAYGTVANADVMEKGRGYVSRLGSNSTITHGAANVKVNTGDQVVTISRTGTTDGKRGYNLVGNPYPAYVSLDILDNPGIESSMWYRSVNVAGNGMVYDTWNFLTETGVVNSGSGALTSDIAPMQAFWVRATNTGNTDVTFRQANTKHQPGSVKLRSSAIASAQKIRVNVSNGTVSDEALFGFYPNAVDSYDAYDSYKFSNDNPAIPELFSYVGSDELAINGMAPLEGEKELVLGFRTGKTGTYTLNATEISNFEEGTKVILKDKLMNVVQDLNASPSYTFTSDATTTDARFSLLITKVATAVKSVDQEPSCLAFAENGGRINVQVNNLDLKNAKINIFDVSGKCLLTKSVESTVTSFDSHLPQGLYLVEVSQGSFAARNKVIINK